MTRLDYQALVQAAQGFNIFNVYDSLMAQMAKISQMPRDMGELVEVCPEFQDKLGPGVSDNGLQTYTVLNYQRETTAALVLAAMQDCLGPAHVHGGNQLGLGEVIVTVSGQLADFSYAAPFSNREAESNSPLVPVVGYKGGTVHQPYAHGFWWGIYFQPHGSKLVTRMNIEEMQAHLASAMPDQAYQALLSNPPTTLDDWLERFTLFFDIKV